MRAEFMNIGIITRAYSGEEKRFLLPVVNAVPENVYDVCGFQRFCIDGVGNNVLTLFCQNGGKDVIERIDITRACKSYSHIMLCVVRAEGACRLMTYCDHAHHALFDISPAFTAAAGL